MKTKTINKNSVITISNEHLTHLTKSLYKQLNIKNIKLHNPLIDLITSSNSSDYLYNELLCSNASCDVSSNVSNISSNTNYLKSNQLLYSIEYIIDDSEDELNNKIDILKTMINSNVSSAEIDTYINDSFETIMKNSNVDVNTLATNDNDETTETTETTDDEDDNEYDNQQDDFMNNIDESMHEYKKYVYTKCNKLDDADEVMNNYTLISKIINNDKITIDKVFCKKSPLLEPLKTINYLYSNDEAFIENTIFNSYDDYSKSKLNDINNASFVEASLLYLTSKLTENELCPTFPLYYGSVNGLSKCYYHNITDEYHALKTEDWFIKHTNNNDIDLYYIDLNDYTSSKASTHNSNTSKSSTLSESAYNTDSDNSELELQSNASYCDSAMSADENMSENEDNENMSVDNENVSVDNEYNSNNTIQFDNLDTISLSNIDILDSTVPSLSTDIVPSTATTKYFNTCNNSSLELTDIDSYINNLETDNLETDTLETDMQHIETCEPNTLLGGSKLTDTINNLATEQQDIESPDAESQNTEQHEPEQQGLEHKNNEVLNKLLSIDNGQFSFDEDEEDDNYFLTSISEKLDDTSNIYETNSNIPVNIINKIDEVTSNISSLDLEDVLNNQKHNKDNNNKTYFIKMQNYPVNICFMEKMLYTLDDLLNEDYNMSDTEWLSVLFQVAFGLAVANKHYNFVHNDLHSDNIMFQSTDKEYLYFSFNKKYYKLPTFGKITKIIDFARGICKINNNWIFSDVFHPEGEAAGQYDYPSNNKDSLKKCQHKPNPSFDLVRLATTIKDKIDDESPIYGLLESWCQSNDGSNMLYKDDDFDLYIDIAHNCTNAVPKNVLKDNIFKCFKVLKSSIPRDTHIYTL
jgi:hypothetical protein